MDAKIPIIWHPGSTYLNVVSQTTHISVTNRNACLCIFFFTPLSCQTPTIVLNHCIAWHVIPFHSIIQFEWRAAGSRQPGEESQTRAAEFIHECWLPSSVSWLLSSIRMEANGGKHGWRRSWGDKSEGNRCCFLAPNKRLWAILLP